jgi:NAD(P)-dependent dehydrogenase (short-subunit alcohol dehydrogenase family)
MDHFKDKVAIVTGGGSGTGRALCKELVLRKAKAVIVADINIEQAQQTASAIAANSAVAQAAHVDVTNAETVRALIDKAVSKFGRLDYMFNNAGIAIRGEFRDMDIEHWRHIIDVNLWGVIHGSLYAYQAMVRQGFGHIVNIASAAGLVPMPLATAYAATKHAVVGLSTSLRAEGAGLGVRVSVACPGFIRTGIFDTTVKVTKIKSGAAYPDLSAIKMMEAGECARLVLRGVERNKAIITVSGFARLLWLLNRIHPALVPLLFRRRINKLRSVRSES